MEIEKKYLVKAIPAIEKQWEKWEIEQCYLCSQPVIRIRKKNEDYILTYKNHCNWNTETPLSVADEIEVPLTKEAFYHLKQKADGIVIRKTRYRIPYGDYIIELDIFHDTYKGFYLAEVEFPTVEQAEEFKAPDWFGQDVSGDFHYTNSYLSKEK